MDRTISRRDFLDGVAVSGAALALAAGAEAATSHSTWPQDQPGYQPPFLSGMRGSHAGSFDTAHALRDGDFWSAASGLRALAETYDLVVVGAGISGLAAARFYQDAHPKARILILDNHDDLGGHAKRNAFRLDGRLRLMNGGTLEIDSPRPYSVVADGLLRRLGVEPVKLAQTCDRKDLYAKLGMGGGVFFDQETFGEDRLVAGAPSRWEPKSAAQWSEFITRVPMPVQARADLLRLETQRIDYLAGLTREEKVDALSRMSYRDFLLKVTKAHPLVAAYYQTHTQGEWGVGIDAVSALDCWGFFMPGLQGLGLGEGAAPRMSFTPAGYHETGGSYVFHFPDGNATLARLLARSLIPACLAPGPVEQILEKDLEYAALDRAANTVRLRLSSTAVRVRNRADGGVELAYARGGRVFGVRAGACVLACWNMIIPYLCPDLPEPQKAALHQIVKTPLVYTSVALRNWRAFERLKVASIVAPGGYHTSMRLDMPVDIGDYRAERSPDKPILLRMTRTPCRPGLPEHDQNRAGRAELLTTPFETFEREIRGQLQRTLGSGGFSAADDIVAITVNRWPHGYAPEWNPLWGQVYPPGQEPNVIGRARFGAIAIANSDAGAAAYTDCAIDQAHRAVNELLTLRSEATQIGNLSGASRG